MKQLIDRLKENKYLEKEEFVHLLKNADDECDSYLFEQAREIATQNFGNKIYTRGLIEFSNYCRNDCYYCGIRRSNRAADRYRLTEEQILSCCAEGYELGFRTYVLQGGEDPFFNDDKIADIIHQIKAAHPDCAITLSMGEKSYDSYKYYFDAGADRYLLRHETADPDHYARLHPKELKLENRKKCLAELKKIGYQVGTGFMVGSPYQTLENLADDLLFIHEFQPHMVGIGPFISHKDTPFSDMENGTLEMTVRLTGILRLMLPNGLLPSTTALGTIDPNGREKGILAGANVVMPNLSPVNVREKYALYDNKICTGDEAAQCRFCLQGRMQKIGYELTVSRGDHQEVAEQLKM